MRVVPVKEVEQQAVLIVHRARQLLVAERTALVNETHGLLAEYGLIVFTGVGVLRRALPELLETPALPGLAREVFADLADRLCALDERIVTYDRRVAALARQTESAHRLMQAPGVGPVTATALVATVGNIPALKHGRQFAAWLGLAPHKTFQWQHPLTGPYHEARGCLPLHLVDPRCPRCDGAAHSPHRCHQSLGPGPESPARLQQGGGGAGREAGPDPVGAVGNRAPLRRLCVKAPRTRSWRCHHSVQGSGVNGVTGLTGARGRC